MKQLNHILVVDDDPAARFLTKLMLKGLQSDQQIQECEDGEEALAYIERHCLTKGSCCPDLILLDMNMPKMSGLELVDALSRMGHASLVHSRIAILSSSRYSKELTFLQQRGITTLLEKPLTDAHLAILVEVFGSEISHR